ncbi:MAG: hypothetical protein DYH12_14440 [Sorangiineae bacterium PRO1]|nr:hypothetical protein [Sorangiineae bacterium PRO1]
MHERNVPDAALGALLRRDSLCGYQGCRGETPPGEPHCELHQARQLVATRVRALESQSGEEEVLAERIELEAGSTEEPTLVGAKQARSETGRLTRPVSDDWTQ